MAPQNPHPVAMPTAEHFEEALASGDVSGSYRAFNPAQLGKIAARLAKLTPAVLAALSASGVPIPSGIGAIVQMVVALADAFDGEPQPA